MTVPSELFRNAIDLNRYSTGVARRLIVAYNQIILDAVQQLQGIDEAAAPMKAARLRAILAQLKADAMPKDVMDAAYKASQEIYAELNARNANWRKVYDDYARFLKDENLWFRVAENGFDSFNYLMSSRGR